LLPCFRDFRIESSFQTTAKSTTKSENSKKILELPGPTCLRTRGIVRDVMSRWKNSRPVVVLSRETPGRETDGRSGWIYGPRRALCREVLSINPGLCLTGRPRLHLATLHCASQKSEPWRGTTNNLLAVDDINSNQIILRVPRLAWTRTRGETPRISTYSLASLAVEAETLPEGRGKPGKDLASRKIAIYTRFNKFLITFQPLYAV